MLKTIAQKLIEKYVNGWKENDLEKILGCLSNDCVIVESHGPTYRGKEAVAGIAISRRVKLYHIRCVQDVCI